MAVEPEPSSAAFLFMVDYLKELRKNAAGTAFKKPKEEATKQDEEEVEKELLGGK